MSKVEHQNGDSPKTSTSGMFFHGYSGRPVDQYESPFGDDDPRQHIGDTVVMTTRAELAAVVTDHIADGTRQTLKWKVIDSQVGKVVARSDGRDPNQTSIDDIGDSDSGEYGDYTPPQYDPDAHDGYPPEADEEEGTEFDDPEADDDSARNNPFKVV
ncbi:hypothetical protein JVX90_00085 [Gordonia sp. PDNC005]|uniref:DUF7171 family protein n=1 Tax=Gordonia sp. PDNC005 TaxID=2811424 RepID=UPI0019663E3E|nr:hypothetical protein [Gordonia sp. PDNC005]QRY62711.1 hypothetical protein JVX90_00085 [Gordonia sp. PDNC005]